MGTRLAACSGCIKQLAGGANDCFEIEARFQLGRPAPFEPEQVSIGVRLVLEAVA
jgi:hypothetical protein